MSIIQDIEHRLRGITITEKEAAQIYDIVRMVTRPDEPNTLKQAAQDFGDAFFRLGRVNSDVARTMFSPKNRDDRYPKEMKNKAGTRG